MLKIWYSKLKMKNNKIKRICLTCHKVFFVDKNVVMRGYGKFCSRSCLGSRDYGHKPKAPRIKFVCVICEKKFLRFKSAISKEPNRGKCCSVKCRVKFTIKKFKITCMKCKKRFFVHPSNLKQGQRFCCSVECRKIFKRKKITCKNCSKKIVSYKNRPRKFCSKKCQHIGFSGSKNPMYKIEPKKHPSWKGGIQFLPYPNGWSKKFKENIRIRDNRKCQMCYTQEKFLIKKLDVHHIDYNKNNLSDKNLISLCKPCHTKTNFNRKFWKNKFQEILT